MPIRYRRNRVLIISVVVILVLFYYYYNRSEESPDPVIGKEKQLIIDEVLKRNQKGNLDPVPEKIPTTTVKRQARTVREEFVEIGGKKLRKIDWHDYDAIERENARTGRFSCWLTDSLLSVSLASIRTWRRRCRS